VQNLTRRLAEAAREMVWDYGIAPKDAIHVATALSLRVSVLNTFDAGLIRKSGLVGNPALPISKPFVEQERLDV
jgi:predicted nucleic acid-binding protein